MSTDILNFELNDDDREQVGLSSKLCKEILCRLGQSLCKFNKEVV